MHFTVVDDSQAQKNLEGDDSSGRAVAGSWHRRDPIHAPWQPQMLEGRKKVPCGRFCGCFNKMSLKKKKKNPSVEKCNGTVDPPVPDLGPFVVFPLRQAGPTDLDALHTEVVLLYPSWCASWHLRQSGPLHSRELVAAWRRDVFLGFKGGSREGEGKRNLRHSEKDKETIAFLKKQRSFTYSSLLLLCKRRKAPSCYCTLFFLLLKQIVDSQKRVWRKVIHDCMSCRTIKIVSLKRYAFKTQRANKNTS